MLQGQRSASSVVSQAPSILSLETRSFTGLEVTNVRVAGHQAPCYQLFYMCTGLNSGPHACTVSLSPTLLFSLKPPSLSDYIHGRHIWVPRAFLHLLLHTIVHNTYNIYQHLPSSCFVIFLFLPFLMRWAGALVTIFIEMTSSPLIKDCAPSTVTGTSRRTMPP